MRALVLGGAGFIGTAACKELMRRGVETIAAGRKDRPYGTFTSYRQVDRTDLEGLRGVLDEVRPDLLLDLAAGHVDEIEGTARIFDGERYVLVSCDDHPGRLTIHPHAVLGAGDPTLRIAAYIQRVEDGGPVLLPLETYKRPAGLAWARDVGYACALACDLHRDVHGSYDVAFAGVSLEDLVLAIGQAVGMQVELIPVPRAELPPGASPYEPTDLDGERIRQDLGFEPSALEDCLAEVLAWYRTIRPSHPGYADRAEELKLAARR